MKNMDSLSFCFALIGLVFLLVYFYNCFKSWKDWGKYGFVVAVGIICFFVFAYHYTLAAAIIAIVAFILKRRNNE